MCLIILLARIRMEKPFKKLKSLTCFALISPRFTDSKLELK